MSSAELSISQSSEHSNLISKVGEEEEMALEEFAGFDSNMDNSSGSIHSSKPENGQITSNDDIQLQKLDSETQNMADDKADTATEVDEENEGDDDTNSGNKSNESDDENEVMVEGSEEDATTLILQAVSHKEEGNIFFKSGDYTQASRSYRKGTSLLKNLNHQNSGDDQVKALLLSLQTNLSTVCLKQNKPKQSRDIATKALCVDATNVKALYRRAVANRKLGEMSAARDDLKLALQYEPDNREVKRELIAVKKEIDESKNAEKLALQKAFSQKSSSSFLYNDKEEDERRKSLERQAKEEAEKEALKKRKLEWENECVERLSSGLEVISFEEWDKERKKKEEEAEKAKKKMKKEEEERKKAERKAKKNSNISQKAETNSDDDEPLTEKELQMFRGYKKTKDGRTTSYFTMERSHVDPSVLPSMTPQRLDTIPTNSSRTTQPISNIASLTRTESTSSEMARKQGSAWNEAGTWEEKDTSDWCIKNLRKHLEEASFDGVRFVASVKEIKDLSGDASVAITRGKKCYLFDYHCKVKYDITDSADDQVIASGSLNLPDISSTAICDVIEVQVLPWKKVPKHECTQDATACRSELIRMIRTKVMDFVTEFNREF